MTFKTVKQIDEFISQAESMGMMTEEKRAELMKEREALMAKEKIDSATPLYSRMKALSKYPISPEFEGCVTRTVEKLLTDDPREATEPGLLLGNIQCGKTNTFENIIALAFDKGIEVCVILTKGTKTLAEQTLKRAEKDFAFAKKTDVIDDQMKVVITDIMRLRNRGVSTIATDDDKCRQIIICKKEARNLKSLIDLYERKSPNLKTERTLIVDDEADFASRVYKGSDMNMTLAKVSELIDRFRSIPTYCRYLQVTATPYSLYLQPDGTINLPKDGKYAAPFRPRFTELVPVHSKYIGGKQYYEESRDENSMYSHLYGEVSEKCLQVMTTRNARYLTTTYRSENLLGLSKAICGYFLAASIRTIQEEKRGIYYRSSCLIHAQTAKRCHEWESELVTAMIDKIKSVILSKDGFDLWLNQIMEERYADYAESSRKGHKQGLLPSNIEMPTYAEAVSKMRGLVANDIAINIVNSDNNVQDLLNEDGQLALDRALNIFIGGSILDRGITVDNMICFFYGRNPKKFQMDTALQHARMYGSRPKEDMAVTRFYTTPRIFTSLASIYEIDDQLREWFTTTDEDGNISPSNAVIIGYDSHLKPCAASKIKASDTRVVKAGSRVLPVGFQTGEKEEVAPIVEQLDKLIESLPGFVENDAFLIDFSAAEKILHLIEQTYVYNAAYENQHLEWHADNMTAIIWQSIKDLKDKKLWCQYCPGRQISRKMSNGLFTAEPEGGNVALATARRYATELPVLTLLRQEGKKSQGWMGTPFYWPALLTPKSYTNSIYALNAQKEAKENNTSDVGIKELLKDIPKEQILHLDIQEQYFRAIYFGLKKEEFRVLKPSDAGKYIQMGPRNKYILAPGVSQDDLDADIFSLNDGKFPFVFKQYKYIHFTIPFLRGDAGNLLVKLKEEPDYVSAFPDRIEDDDIVYDEFGDDEEVDIDNEFGWIIKYKLDKVIGPRNQDYEDWKNENPDIYDDMAADYGVPKENSNEKEA